MYLKVQGLVLRVTAYHETDSLLTLITADQGKLTVKARGLRRKNNSLTACCQLLAYGEFTLFENRGFYTVQEANSIELFMPLRKDLCKLSMGSYFAQVAEVMCQEDTPDPELLSLLLNSLYALCHLDLPEDQVKGVFEFRSACIGGYLPELSGCIYCNQPFPDRFDIGRGSLVCSNCDAGNPGTIRMPVDSPLIEVMRYVAFCDGKKLFSFRVGDLVLSQFSTISELYLSTQLERGFSALDFYKSLLCT